MYAASRSIVVWILLALAAGCSKDGDDSGSPATGGYEDGVYHCCDEGDGTSCCGGYEPGMCSEYGGIYGACIADGEEFEGKIECAFCCDGLVQAQPMIETDEFFSDYPAGCGPSEAPPSIVVCVACGDGTCGPGENRCVCPDDCAG